MGKDGHDWSFLPFDVQKHLIGSIPSLTLAVGARLQAVSKDMRRLINHHCPLWLATLTNLSLLMENDIYRTMPSQYLPPNLCVKSTLAAKCMKRKDGARVMHCSASMHNDPLQNNAEHLVRRLDTARNSWKISVTDAENWFWAQERARITWTTSHRGEWWLVTMMVFASIHLESYGLYLTAVSPDGINHVCTDMWRFCCFFANLISVCVPLYYSDVFSPFSQKYTIGRWIFVSIAEIVAFIIHKEEHSLSLFWLVVALLLQCVSLFGTSWMIAGIQHFLAYSRSRKHADARYKDHMAQLSVLEHTFSKHPDGRFRLSQASFEPRVLT
jgi:hypothetical protein